MHERTVAFLTEILSQPLDGKAVVITHHAPSPQSVAPEYKNDKLSPSFASHLEHLMGEAAVLWAHGHAHNFNDYKVNGTRVVSNPRGCQFPRDLVSESGAFQPDLVAELKDKMTPIYISREELYKKKSGILQ